MSHPLVIIGAGPVGLACRDQGPGQMARARGQDLGPVEPEAAAALAVAHPDEGALTEASIPEGLFEDAVAESLVTVAEARNNDDDSPIRKVVENKCKVDEKEEKKAPPKKEEAPAPKEAPAPAPVEQLPDTGIGMAGAAGLSSLFAAASAAAALGSVALRGRRESGILALGSTVRED